MTNFLSLPQTALSYITPIVSSHPYSAIALGATTAAAGLVYYKRNQIVASLKAKANLGLQSVVSDAIDNGKKTALKEAATVTVNLMSSLLNKIPQEIKNDHSNGFTALEESKNTLFALAHNDGSSTQELIDGFKTIYSRLRDTEISIQGFEVFGKTEQTQEAAPTAEELLSLLDNQPAAAEASIEELKKSFSKELSQLFTCIRRKQEATSVFGEQLPPALIASINTPHERDYQRVLLNEINNKVHSSQVLSFIRPVIISYLRIKRFFISLIVGYVTRKIDLMLNKKIHSFIFEGGADGSHIMDYLAKSLVNGLNLFNNELINIATEVAHNPSHLHGTPSDMLSKGLSDKPSLRAGYQTQKEFYEKVFDDILAETFSFSLQRRLIKSIVNSKNYLDDPFNSVPQTIRDANGFQYNLDQSIANLLTPLLKQMQSEAPEAPEAQPAFRNFSHQNKKALANAIKTLFLATDINNASDVTKMIHLIDQAKKGASPISSDGLIASTAETGAFLVLEKLNTVMNPKFLLERAVDSLRTLNSTFSTSRVITADEMAEAERKRKEVLDQLTKVVVHKSVENAPILNSGKHIALINAKIVELKNFAEEIKNYTHERVQHYRDSEPHVLDLDKEAIEGFIKRSQSAHKELERLATQHELDQEQKTTLLKPLEVINTHLKSLIEAYHFAGPLQEKCHKLETAQVTLQESISSKVFAKKADISLADVPVVKKVTKLILNRLLQDKFNKIYDYSCDPKTVKYLGIHQPLAALLKA